jgi:hypothetical protein
VHIHDVLSFALEVFSIEILLTFLSLQDGDAELVEQIIS